MGEPSFIFRGIGSNFSILFHFSMKNMSANRIAPDGTPRFHLGLFCLPMSHKKDARLIWVLDNIYEYDKNACIVVLTCTSSSLLCIA